MIGTVPKTGFAYFLSAALLLSEGTSGGLSGPVPVASARRQSPLVARLHFRLRGVATRYIASVFPETSIFEPSLGQLKTHKGQPHSEPCVPSRSSKFPSYP
jgi:hypothetical protein